MIIIGIKFNRYCCVDFNSIDANKQITAKHSIDNRKNHLGIEQRNNALSQGPQQFNKTSET